MEEQTPGLKPINLIGQQAEAPETEESQTKRAEPDTSVQEAAEAGRTTSDQAEDTHIGLVTGDVPPQDDTVVDAYGVADSVAGQIDEESDPEPSTLESVNLIDGHDDRPSEPDEIAPDHAGVRASAWRTELPLVVATDVVPRDDVAIVECPRCGKHFPAGRPASGKVRKRCPECGGMVKVGPDSGRAMPTRNLVRIHCPLCRAKLATRCRSRLAREIRCPTCRGKFVLPSHEDVHAALRRATLPPDVTLDDQDDEDTPEAASPDTAHRLLTAPHADPATTIRGGDLADEQTATPDEQRQPELTDLIAREADRVSSQQADGPAPEGKGLNRRQANASEPESRALLIATEVVRRRNVAVVECPRCGKEFPSSRSSKKKLKKRCPNCGRAVVVEPESGKALPTHNLVRAYCPLCHAKLAAQCETWDDRQIKCPACRGDFILPAGKNISTRY